MRTGEGEREPWVTREYTIEAQRAVCGHHSFMGVRGRIVTHKTLTRNPLDI